MRSLDRAGVAGPVFISVAPRETASEKMNKFLDINPMVPRERLFVDDSPTFAAYASAGFKNIGEDQKTSLADATKLTAPRLSAGAWWRYLTNVASLSPVPDGLKFGEVPEGDAFAYIADIACPTLVYGSLAEVNTVLFPGTGIAPMWPHFPKLFEKVGAARKELYVDGVAAGPRALRFRRRSHEVQGRPSPRGPLGDGAQRCAAPAVSARH